MLVQLQLLSMMFMLFQYAIDWPLLLNEWCWSKQFIVNGHCRCHSIFIRNFLSSKEREREWKRGRVVIMIEKQALFMSDKRKCGWNFSQLQQKTEKNLLKNCFRKALTYLPSKVFSMSLISFATKSWKRKDFNFKRL